MLVVVALAAPARASSTCRDGDVEYTLEMTDIWGDGWDDAAYNFTRSSDGAASTGTLARGATGAAALCLAPADVGGCHAFKVSAGSWPSEISWSIASEAGTTVGSGGAPTTVLICFTFSPLPLLLPSRSDFTAGVAVEPGGWSNATGSAKEKRKVNSAQNRRSLLGTWQNEHRRNEHNT